MWSFVSLVGSTSPLFAAAEETQSKSDCSEHTVNQPLAEKFGSVSLLANLRGAPDSIRAVARQLLSAAIEAAPPNPATCPIGCAPLPATIVYKVAPSAYLKHQKQRELCLKFERETAETPLRFAEKQFASLDDMNEWMMDFSRGKGPDGKALYRLCSSNCSPRYTFLVNHSNSVNYQVETEVVCGLARDRANNNYNLSTALRSRCMNGSF